MTFPMKWVALRGLTFTMALASLARNSVRRKLLTGEQLEALWRREQHLAELAAERERMIARHLPGGRW